jgi:hypothetical protein
MRLRYPDTQSKDATHPTTDRDRLGPTYFLLDHHLCCQSDSAATIVVADCES